jgi:3',5'-cyclic AMP phosphodiesterase CpdA
MYSRGEPGARRPAARGNAFRRRVRVTAAFALLLAAGAAASASADFPDSDTLGATTLEQRVVPNADAGFRELALGPGESAYTVREEGVGTAQSGRETRRTSLVYFGQLSDFQLADEESPARVEFIDTGPFSAAWRPWEALNPQIDDAMIRQLNAFAGASPVAAGDGLQRAMDFTINTGDAADSQQLNETTWVRQLMEGGPIDPGSGVDPGTSSDAVCSALDLAGLVADGNAPQKYTGVQDFSDYTEGVAPQFYDPNNPASAYSDWPEYEGLMDRAQQPFIAEGLDVPSYITFGNHDALVQGNAAANAVYELVATGCLKVTSPIVADPGSLADALGALNPANLLNLLLTDPTKVGLVPPDPRRQFVSKKQYKDVFLDGSQTDGHGFEFIDPAEEAASAGAAGYYAWSPLPGIRFISLDTVSEAGVVGPSADGNIDHPQFQWLEAELEAATAADELVVLFSHHAIPSLTADVADELAPPCTVPDAHGHDVNPGCDLDPRDSAPIHLGDDMEALMHQYPHAIAWVAGHSHVNSIEPHPNPSGTGGFWSIRVAAEADWPQQSRLLEVFDNDDGTLSIFGTILDHAGSANAPGPGDASGFDIEELASVGRTIAYNDTQAGGRACDGGPCGEGGIGDRNVELLVDDPRTGESPPPPPPDDGDGDGNAGGGRCANEVVGTPADDRLVGTSGSDLVRGRGGNDRLRGRHGRDCLRAGRGRDRVNGGKSAGDRIGAGGGRDRVNARDGKRDTVRCGTGRDVARVDSSDVVAGSCEQVRIE